MSFFQSLTAGAKALGTLAVQKAQDTYDNLRSPPQQIDCSFCPNPVMVPPAVFNWKCACTTINLMQSEKCTVCGLIKPGNMPRPQILCTMCNRVNEVPWTNAEVQAARAAKATKKAVEAAAVKAKDTFNEMKSTPVFFNCEHCNSSLANPNNPPPNAQGAPLAYSPQPQAPAAVILPQVTKTTPAPASAPPNSPPEVTHVLCTCCRKETSVPGSVFVNSVKVSGQKIAKGATQAYYMVSDQRYANCPVCASPVSLPPAHQPQPVQNQAPAPRGQAAVPYTAPAPVRVDLLCEKCGTQFPTVA